MNKGVRCILSSPRAWHLDSTARGLEEHGALAALFISDRNRVGLSAAAYRQCRWFFIADRLLSRVRGSWAEWLFWRAPFIWDGWYQRRELPAHNVVHARQGFCKQPFLRAAGRPVLRVVDCCNSHPVTAFGYWQRECDLFNPGAHPSVALSMFGRMNRELEDADLVLCPSEFVRDTMVMNGIAEQKCVVLPFGVSETFRARLVRQVPAREPMFVFVGQVGLRKGCQYLFPAFAEVRRQFPAARLVCIGGVLKEFRSFAARYAGVVELAGWQPPERVRDYLGRALAMVMPSVEEGQARVLNEGLAAGLPLIATYESGVTSLIQDGVEGIVVKARRVDQLGAAMKRLLANADEAETMRHSALSKARELGSWTVYAQRLIEIYQDRLLSMGIPLISA